MTHWRMSSRVTVAEIDLGNGRVALVDAEDMAWASQYSWYFKESSLTGYARSKSNEWKS